MNKWKDKEPQKIRRKNDSARRHGEEREGGREREEERGKGLTVGAAPASEGVTRGEDPLEVGGGEARVSGASLVEGPVRREHKEREEANFLERVGEGVGEEEKPRKRAGVSGKGGPGGGSREEGAHSVVLDLIVSDALPGEAAGARGFLEAPEIHQPLNQDTRTAWRAQGAT